MFQRLWFEGKEFKGFSIPGAYAKIALGIEDHTEYVEHICICSPDDLPEEERRNEPLMIKGKCPNNPKNGCDFIA